MAIEHRSSLADHPEIGAIVPAFVERLAGYVRQMRELMAAAQVEAGGVDVEAAREALRGLMHKLVGSGKSYGFDAISVYAGAVEEMLLAGRGMRECAGIIAKLITYIEGIEGYKAVGESA